MKRNKNKTKKFIRKAFKQKYPPFYLALSLVVFSTVFAMMFGSVTVSDWDAGLALIDVSAQFTESVANFSEAVTPMLDLVDGVAKFYKLAADEMAALLVVDDFEKAFVVVAGVNDFYRLASLEMEVLLDLSYLIPVKPVPQVAGACVESF